MIRRKSYFNENECNNICHAFAHHTSGATATMTTTVKPAATVNDSNDLNNNDNNDSDSSSNSHDDINNNNNNNNKTTTLGHELSDEMDNISLEILWQPENSGTPISADIVFIHGLHGKQILHCNRIELPTVVTLSILV